MQISGAADEEVFLLNITSQILFWLHFNKLIAFRFFNWGMEESFEVLDLRHSFSE